MKNKPKLRRKVQGPRKEEREVRNNLIGTLESRRNSHDL
jgi:hypothetical protein